MTEQLIAYLHRSKLEIARRFPFLASMKHGSVQGYLVTLALMGLALWMRLAIAPVSAGLQYVTFFPAVTLAAIVAGYRAGLLATAIGLAFATYIFTPPYYSISMAVLQTSLWSNMVFLIDGIIVSLAIESMHRYRRRHALELAQSRAAHVALLASTKELQQSEAMLEQFKFTLDHTQDGVFMFRPDTLRFIYVNHGAKRQVGYGTDELLQMTPLDIKPNFSEPQFRALLQPLLDGSSKPSFFETVHRHKDGHDIPVEIVLQLVERDDLKPRFVAFSRDISERKRNESELRIAAAAFDSQEGIMVTDANSVILRINKAFTESTGYSAAEIVGQTPRIVKSGRHDAAFYAAMWESIKHTGSWEGEIWNRHKDGAIHPKYMTITAVKSDAGAVTHYIGAETDITARKCAEAALHDSEAWFRSIFENVSTGIASSDSSGRVTSFNEAFRNMLGYDAETLSEMNFAEFTHPDDIALEIEFFNEILEQKRDSYQIEKRYITSDGHIIWIDISIAVIRGENGEVKNFVGVVTDITERKHAEGALHATTERLNEAQRIAHLGAWELNVGSGKLTWSDEVFRIFEIDPNRFGTSYESFLEAIHPEDRDKVNLAYTDSLKSRSAYEITHRLLMSDGRIKWVLERGVSDFDAFGKPLRSRGMIQDITDRMKAEEELSLAASVFSNSAEGVVITDADSIILSVNPAFEEITGYTANEVLGQKPSLLRSDRHGPEFYRDMWAALLNESNWKGEIWNRRKNGEAYLEWLTINRIADSTGATVRFVSVFHDITELRRKDEHIRHQAFHDALTGLPNRALFQERLHHALERSKRDGNRLSVTFIDLDGFKNVNDTLGHDVGDVLLQGVANRIRARLRRGIDTVARLGGDEFVLLMEDLQETDFCARLAGEIIADISRPFELGSHEVMVGASIGMAFYPEDGDSVQELMKCADTAMYAAKTAGKGTYRFFQSGMLQEVTARLTLEAELRNALKQRQFVLHYQPQLDLRSGRIVGVEALVRWQHPERGLISPIEFIPVAEETGLIISLGDWVLGEACQQLGQWRTHGLDDLRMSVNLSANQFLDPGLPLRIEKILERTDVPPNRIDLEVTESTAMKEPSDAAAMMRVLTAQKLSLSIDDFGTGYSSLAYLKQFPISTLKIDRTFVKDIETDPDDAGICDVTVLLAHKLGLDVVAEGVETAGQLKFLLSIGCEKIQGYLICKPLPADQAEEFIRNSSLMNGLGTIDLWVGSAQG